MENRPQNMLAKQICNKSGLKYRPFQLLFTALVVGVGLTASAHGSNIVVDGDFESAGGGNVYFAGQSIDGGSWNVTQGAIFIDTQDPWVFDGNNSANLSFANLFVPNTLSQTLTTVVGQHYLLTFFGNADTPNTFSLTENGIAVAGTPNSIAQNGFTNNTNSSLFTDYSGEFVASSTSTTLDFTSTGDPSLGSPDGSVMVDDVSLQPVPEPGTIALTLTGIMGLVAGRKRLDKSA
jgi:hypothetical protein